MSSQQRAILVVDDFVTMRRILRNMLRQLGYDTIVEAKDGAVALQMLRQQDIHLVISDVNMPQMSGLELLQAIRADATLHSLPVLLITAEAEKDTIVEAVRLEVNGYIVKPFTPRTLQENIEKIFAPRAALP